MTRAEFEAEFDRFFQRINPVVMSRFSLFHEQNQHVYNSLRSLALGLVSRGVRKYGMKGLFEVLRWQYAHTTRGEEFKLNNNYTAIYARLLMYEEEELADFFDLRESPARDTVEDTEQE